MSGQLDGWEDGFDREASAKEETGVYVLKPKHGIVDSMIEGTKSGPVQMVEMIDGSTGRGLQDKQADKETAGRWHNIDIGWGFN